MDPEAHERPLPRTKHGTVARADGKPNDRFANVVEPFGGTFKGANDFADCLAVQDPHARADRCPIPGSDRRTLAGAFRSADRLPDGELDARADEGSDQITDEGSDQIADEIPDEIPHELPHTISNSRGRLQGER